MTKQKKVRCEQIAQIIPAVAGWRAVLIDPRFDHELDESNSVEDVIETAEGINLEDATVVVTVPAFALVREWDSEELLHGNAPPAGVYVWESIRPCLNQTSYTSLGMVQLGPVDSDIPLAILGPGELMSEEQVRGHIALSWFIEIEDGVDDEFNAGVRQIESQFRLYSAYG